MENNKLNLVEILKDAPKGTKLYSPIFGDVELYRVHENRYFPICVQILQYRNEDCLQYFTASGTLYRGFENAEPQLFPSKENRDWSTFKVKSKFPTTIEDCCDTLGIAKADAIDYELSILRKFQKLLIIRDAWWKADNNWKPNWESQSFKATICRNRNIVDTGSFFRSYHILAFRTADIRNKFLDTFRDLIEECKEFI